MSDFFEESCFKCGVVFGMPKALHNTCVRDKQTFYCPNGHGQAYVTSEADKLRTKLQAAEQATRAAEERAAREERWRVQANEVSRTLERRLAAQRGVTTKMKKRIAGGACPCCNRTFLNLHRHMQTKHKGFVVEEVQTEVGQTMQ